MKSLFNTEDNHEIVERINKLTPAAERQWGKMHVNQMLSHCQRPLRVAFGELKLKRGIISFLFGKIARKKLTGPAPFKKGLPTDHNFIVKDNPDFESSKRNLISLTKRFAEKGEAAIAHEYHPFFGKLTVKEWDILQWKHLDHHLRQFGV
jgi:hypothetical protein